MSEATLDGYKPLKRSGLTRKVPLTAKTSLISRKPSKLATKKKVKKKKKLSDGQLKKRVWVQFSIFIRTRNANLAVGTVRCITCKELNHWKNQQAGHFIRGRLNANLFDERGCQVQCYTCNIHRQGNVVEYYEWMLAHYGKGVIDELREQNKKTKKWAPGELAGLLDHYKQLNAANPLTAKEPQ